MNPNTLIYIEIPSIVSNYIIIGGFIDSLLSLELITIGDWQIREVKNNYVT